MAKELTALLLLCSLRCCLTDCLTSFNVSTFIPAECYRQCVERLYSHKYKVDFAACSSVMFDRSSQQCTFELCFDPCNPKGSLKVGVITPFCEVLGLLPNISWWGNDQSNAVATSMTDPSVTCMVSPEYVPRREVTATELPFEVAPKYLMSGNSPELDAHSIPKFVTEWDDRESMAAGAFLLVGPCVAANADGIAWYTKWQMQCNGTRGMECSMAAVCCLVNDYNATVVLDSVTSFAQSWNLPVWVSDIRCTTSSYDDCNETERLTFAKALVPLLDASPLVLRWSWHSQDLWRMVGNDSQLTSLGVYIRDFAGGEMCTLSPSSSSTPSPSPTLSVSVSPSSQSFPLTTSAPVVLTPASPPPHLAVVPASPDVVPFYQIVQPRPAPAPPVLIPIDRSDFVPTTSSPLIHHGHPPRASLVVELHKPGFNWLLLTFFIPGGLVVCAAVAIAVTLRVRRKQNKSRLMHMEAPWVTTDDWGTHTISTSDDMRMSEDFSLRSSPDKYQMPTYDDTYDNSYVYDEHPS